MKKFALGFILLLALCFVMVSLPESNIVKAIGTIYIRSDGTVVGTDKIQRDGNLYTFTANIYDPIVVERDNIVVDGAGYTLQGGGSGRGIELSGIRKNVTVENFNIKNFHTGIYIGGPYTGAWGEEGGNTIFGNIITNNKYGIWLKDSPDNVFRNNEMADNEQNLVIEPTTTTLHYRQDIDASNTVDGKPIYYWINEQDRTVPSDAGYVALLGCKRITVKNLIISKNGKGILLFLTTDSTIASNTLTNNSYGIYIESSNNNTISGNNLTNNNYGIFLLVSHFNVFRNNRMVDNGQNLIVHGGDYADLTQYMDASNTVNGKPVYYWVEERGKTVPPDAGYVALVRCTDITVQNLNLTNNGQGILLASTIDSTITKNTITNNGEGLYLWDSSNNIISENIITNNNRAIHILGTYPTYSPNNRIYGNNIANNNEFGIVIVDSSNNTIYGNNIANNGNGIYIEWGGASNNTIYHNNFINNTADVPGGWHYIGPAAYPVWIPPPYNVWDYSKEGNYWSDYVTRYPNATEIDSLGIWGTPYNISENNQDNYPLMKPVNISAIIIPEFPDTMPPTISIVSPENKTYTVNNVSLTFNVSEPTSWMGYSLDAQANVTIAGNTTLTGLSDGSHSLIVYAKDIAGNTGASETIYFRVSQPEPFPTTWIATPIAIAAVVGAALLVYLVKVKKTTGKTEKLHEGVM